MELVSLLVVRVIVDWNLGKIINNEILPLATNDNFRVLVEVVLAIAAVEPAPPSPNCCASCSPPASVPIIANRMHFLWWQGLHHSCRW